MEAGVMGVSGVSCGAAAPVSLGMVFGAGVGSLAGAGALAFVAARRRSSQRLSRRSMPPPTAACIRSGLPASSTMAVGGTAAVGAGGRAPFAGIAWTSRNKSSVVASIRVRRARMSSRISRSPTPESSAFHSTRSRWLSSSPMRPRRRMLPGSSSVLERRSVSPDHAIEVISPPQMASAMIERRADGRPWLAVSFGIKLNELIVVTTTTPRVPHGIFS